MQKDGLSPLWKEAQKKHLSFLPVLDSGCGGAGVKGQDERQRTAPLTPAPPRERLCVRSCARKAPKKVLTKPTMSYMEEGEGQSSEATSGRSQLPKRLPSSVDDQADQNPQSDRDRKT